MVQWAFHVWPSALAIFFALSFILPITLSLPISHASISHLPCYDQHGVPAGNHGGILMAYSRCVSQSPGDIASVSEIIMLQKRGRVCLSNLCLCPLNSGRWCRWEREPLLWKTPSSFASDLICSRSLPPPHVKEQRCRVKRMFATDSLGLRVGELALQSYLLCHFPLITNLRGKTITPILKYERTKAYNEGGLPEVL